MTIPLKSELILSIAEDAKRPIVELARVTFTAEFFIATDLYPVVSKLPEPICINNAVVASNDTPTNMIAILFVPEGIPVKSMDVPEVVACSVPSVIPAGRVIFAVPSNDTPLIVRAVCNAVAVAALPEVLSVWVFDQVGAPLIVVPVTVTVPVRVGVA